jgi:carbon storage regulator
MLVLRRKVGESIVLAGVINISVLAVEGERVKIGISAPPDVTIVREELLRASMTDMTPNQGQSNPATSASQR